MEAAAVEDGGGRQRLVVVDDNSWLRSMRRPFYALARDAGASYLTLHLRLGSAEAALERTAARAGGGGESVGAEVIARMASALQAPTAAEGASNWEARYAWTIDASAPPAAVLEGAVQRLVDKVAWAALPCPPVFAPPPPEGAGVNPGAAPPPAPAGAASLLQEMELALRSAVGALLAASPRGGTVGGATGARDAAWAGAREGGKALALAKKRALGNAQSWASAGRLEEVMEAWVGALEEGGGSGVGGEGRGARLALWARAELALCLAHSK